MPSASEAMPSASEAMPSAGFAMGYATTGALAPLSECIIDMVRLELEAHPDADLRDIEDATGIIPPVAAQALEIIEVRKADNGLYMEGTRL